LNNRGSWKGRRMNGLKGKEWNENERKRGGRDKDGLDFAICHPLLLAPMSSTLPTSVNSHPEANRKTFEL